MLADSNSLSMSRFFVSVCVSGDRFAFGCVSLEHGVELWFSVFLFLHLLRVRECDFIFYDKTILYNQFRLVYNILFTVWRLI